MFVNKHSFRGCSSQLGKWDLKKSKIDGFPKRLLADQKAYIWCEALSLNCAEESASTTKQEKLHNKY